MRTVLSMFWVLTMCLGLSSCRESSKAKKLYEEGYKRELKSDADAAMSLYEEVHRRYPKTQVAKWAKDRLAQLRMRGARRLAEKKKQQAEQAARRVSLKLAESIGHVLGATVTDALAFDAKEDAETVLASYALVEGNKYAVVFDEKRNLFAAQGAGDLRSFVGNVDHLVAAAEKAPRGDLRFVEKQNLSIFVKKLVAGGKHLGYIVVAHEPTVSEEK